MKPSLIDVRRFLTEAFSDEETDTFCFDNFPQVQNSFSVGMSKSAKIQRLLEHCQRRELIPQLLSAIKIARPNQYEKYLDTPDIAIRIEPIEAIEPVVLSHRRAVRFVPDVMESIFYRAAEFNHEVGGLLVGHVTDREILIERVHNSFTLDNLSEVSLTKDEMIIGYWHSHIGIGTFLSANDWRVLREVMPTKISVIVDTHSSGETIAAYGILGVTDEIVKLKISQGG